MILALFTVIVATEYRKRAFLLMVVSAVSFYVLDFLLLKSCRFEN